MTPADVDRYVDQHYAPRDIRCADCGTVYCEEEEECPGCRDLELFEIWDLINGPRCLP